jgi:hypothetical protein
VADATENRVVVLLHKLAFRDVIRATFGADDLELVAASSHPPTTRIDQLREEVLEVMRDHAHECPLTTTLSFPSSRKGRASVKASASESWSPEARPLAAGFGAAAEPQPSKVAFGKNHAKYCFKYPAIRGSLALGESTL